MKPNMIEITSAQDLVDSLRSSGDKLVVVGFYSPSCGGCKTLHPKVKLFYFCLITLTDSLTLSSECL